MDSARVQPPTHAGTTDGLAWAAFLPESDAEPAGGVVIIHGADSCKENHADFAAACARAGLAALTFDVRGHGQSEGPLDGRALDDVATMADLLRERFGVRRVGLRGSSMGGWLSLTAAPVARADAVVAICPASWIGLYGGLRAQRFEFAADRESLTELLRANDEREIVRDLDIPLLLMHAEGDEVVPVDLSRELAELAPDVELVIVPGGDHRSVQHDPEMQERAARFLAEHLGAAGGR
mgnify:CR=1 FL=1|jgi:pimeloyl-ACP methyl ester carboxylesterase